MVQNALRKEVNRLNEENDKLTNEVTVLEQQVQRIHEKETELEQITQKQSINSNTFIKLCDTNRTTLDELKVNLTVQFVFDICVYKNVMLTVHIFIFCRWQFRMI